MIIVRRDTSYVHHKRDGKARPGNGANDSSCVAEYQSDLVNEGAGRTTSVETGSENSCRLQLMPRSKTLSCCISILSVSFESTEPDSCNNAREVSPGVAT